MSHKFSLEKKNPAYFPRNLPKLKNNDDIIKYYSWVQKFAHPPLKQNKEEKEFDTRHLVSQMFLNYNKTIR